MLPGELRTWSATGGSHSTTPMPAAQMLADRHRRRAGGSARRHRTMVATAASATIPTPSGRYGTWVWAQYVAVMTSGTRATASPHSTHQVASSTTTQATTGRYGFHGWVSVSWP